MVAWVDKNWFKKYLVSKSSEEIFAADQIDDELREFLEQDEGSADPNNLRNTQNFATISPVVRQILEKRLS